MIYLNDFRGNWETISKALPTLIAKYEDEINDAPKYLSLNGKTGTQAQKEQCAWPVHYGILKAEVSKLLKYIAARVDAVRGERSRWYIESYSRDLGEKDRQRFVDNDDQYLRMYELYLEVEELRDKFAAICDAFDRRGFALRDWTALRVNEITDMTI